MILHAQNFSTCHFVKLHCTDARMVQYDFVDTCIARIWVVCSVCNVIHFSDLGAYWIRTHYVWHIEG